MSESAESLLESEVIFQDTSIDGSATITVWRDEPVSALSKEVGAMGILRVYSSDSGELYHEERLALSPSAILGPGPTEQESTRWSNIVALFMEE